VRFVTFEITATGVLPFECLFRSPMSCAVHSRRTRRLVGLAIFAFLPELFVNASISCAFGLKPLNQHHGQGAGCFSSAALRELSERILEFGAISERPSLHISASGLTALALVVQNVEFVGFKKTPGNAVR